MHVVMWHVRGKWDAYGCIHGMCGVRVCVMMWYFVMYMAGGICVWLYTQYVYIFVVYVSCMWYMWLCFIWVWCLNGVSDE